MHGEVFLMNFKVFENVVKRCVEYRKDLCINRTRV